MNAENISNAIKTFVVDGELTYADFEKIFSFLPRKEQYAIVNLLSDELHIELVDELSTPTPAPVAADEKPPAVKKKRDKGLK